jgi:hypothetical protein
MLFSEPRKKKHKLSSPNHLTSEVKFLINAINTSDLTVQQPRSRLIVKPSLNRPSAKHVREEPNRIVHTGVGASLIIVLLAEAQQLVALGELPTITNPVELVHISGPVALDLPGAFGVASVRETL